MLSALCLMALLSGPHDTIMVEIRIPAPVEVPAPKPPKSEKKNDRN